MQHYRIHGALGSPYSIKMRAVLRYRRIPHEWIQLDMEKRASIAHIRPPVIPVIEYPEGDMHADSTPVIYDLEKRHQGRSIIPDDEGQAFLAFLLEDMADEWGTKMMFHYRWYRERDQEQMSAWLAWDHMQGGGLDNIEKYAQTFRKRQVERMAIVGCTDENRDVIEQTCSEIFSILDKHVLDEPYLFGSRPSLADFGWMGQLSQLAVDPTPQERMREQAPFLYRWIAQLDDASGVEGQWRDPSVPTPETIRQMLEMAAEIYFPFLEANKAAFEAGEAAFGLSLRGKPYRQGTFKYQVRCLQELRKRFAALDNPVKSALEPLLKETGCWHPLTLA